MSEARFSGVRLTVVAPSRQWQCADGSIDWATHERAMLALEALGFTVTMMGGAYLEDRRFAGCDSARASDLMAALTEVPADMVMALRGGWGAARILPLLDWEALAAHSATMPPLVGFSDFTALNLAFYAKLEQASWQGPTLKDLIEPAALTLEGLEMVLGRKSFSLAWSGAEALGCAERFSTTGTLWGGNLTVLCALLGSEYFPRFSESILFIEDVGEAAYKIDRMLVALSLAGALRGVRAIVVGDCAGADRACAWAGDFSLAHALEDAQRREGIPIVTGLPFGHIHEKASLPFGARVTLTHERGRSSLSLA